MAKWIPASNGSGARHWFVCKPGTPNKEHKSTRGTLIRYASYEAAQKVATQLNEGDNG
jgi:hypothetical protein